ncbi:hypothetical protein ACFVR2_19525 [Gottfriedia sp. NPDC057991]|uniref:hypothetical protein n=1 Tax=Gottfriedia sp. NPDC057991 TaxID=3346298 RepID=UPI0036D8F65E
MEKYFSVKEVTALLGYKNDETIKRKIKDGMFPGAIQKSRKEGWKIPASDLAMLSSPSLTKIQDKNKGPSLDYKQTYIVKLAYQVATLTSPTEDVQKLLSSLSLERALEICLIIRQQNRYIDDPYKFIKAAKTKNWMPDPITLEKKKRLVDTVQREVKLDEKQQEKLPLYNWLEKK